MSELSLARALAEAVRKAFEDPDVKREYEEWLHEQQDTGELV